MPVIPYYADFNIENITNYNEVFLYGASDSAGHR